jgi:hypothetical protein
LNNAFLKIESNLRLARLGRPQPLWKLPDDRQRGRRRARRRKRETVHDNRCLCRAALGFDLPPPFEERADPVKDREAMALASAKKSRRARRSAGLDHDF